MVLCECTTSSQKQTNTGFIYKSNDIKLYKVLDVGPKVDANYLAVGDIVVVNSTGTLVKVGEVEYYLFKEENIVGKVIS